MCDRFSADGFRTLAVRVIRRRVLGFDGQREKPRERERDFQVIPGRWENGVCVYVCALCPQGGDPRAVSHLHTHTPFSAPRNQLDVPFSLSRFFPLVTRTPSTRRRITRAARVRKPSAETRSHIQKFSFFRSSTCVVPPTHHTHTCIRFPLLLPRLPCTRYLASVFASFRLHFLGFMVHEPLEPSTRFP